LKHHELIRSIDTTSLTEKKKAEAKPWLMPGYLRQLSREFVVFFHYSELIGAVLLILLYHITKLLSRVSGWLKSIYGQTATPFSTLLLLGDLT